MFQKMLALSLCILLTTYGYSQESTANEKETFALPTPTGKYQVGRYWTSFKDSSHQREVAVFLYYPVKGSKVLDYIIPTKEWRIKYQSALQKKLGDSAGKAVAHAKAFFAKQPDNIGEEKFPLVLFSPGLGWSTLEYSFIIHELVSAGYIVAAINTPSISPVLQMPEGRFLSQQSPADRYQQAADDMVYVLQQLKKPGNQLERITAQIDFTNIAASGHSLGGAAAILAAHTEMEIKTAVNMDGDLLEGSLKATPGASILFLNQIPAEFETLSFDDMKKDKGIGWRYQQMSKTTSKSSSGMYISVAGMYHSNYQDYALLPKSLIPEKIRKWRLGPIDGDKGLMLIKQTLITYFDEMLKGKKGNWNKFQEENSLIRIIKIK